MDNIFLAKILKEQARLIIPGFGAFLKKEGVSAGLVFSPFLKKDDGVLVALLCQEYGVSNFDGEGMIAEWVQHIREALATTGRYHIDGVGMLMLDANGAIAMVEEPVRKPVQQSAQQVQSVTVSQTNPMQPRPLVQAEPVAPNREFVQPAGAPIAQPVAPNREFVQPAGAPIAQPVAPNTATTATIAQQIVEQIQQAPSRPLVAPQPIGQVAPRVAPRPMGVAPQGVAPRPAAPATHNMQRPGMPQGMPQQPRPQGAGVQQRTQQNPQEGGQRQQGAPVAQQGDQMRAQGSGAPARPQSAGKRPPQRPGRKQKKYSSTEIWLLVAIVAALIVTGIIIWGLMVLSPTQEFYSTDEVIVDSTTMVDTIPANTNSTK